MDLNLNFFGHLDPKLVLLALGSDFFRAQGLNCDFFRDLDPDLDCNFYRVSDPDCDFLGPGPDLDCEF